MTQAEKKMKNYVNAVERRLNLPREIKARVMSDFQSSIVARREAGQTDEEIYAELGTPAKAAADLNEQMKDYTYRKSPWRFLFLGIAAIGGVRLLYDGFVSLIGYFILRRELVQVRTQGYAVDMQESVLGLKCVAAPIFSIGGRLEGALGVSALAFRLPDVKLPSVARTVCEQARLLSASLGYNG